ncbi:MAG: twin-arginine translocation signal domain-containing protein [Proteobacteria bacterium]|nr:twin-arginine translocation signal domain-containing protein [Pseudomonadota bacterium]
MGKKVDPDQVALNRRRFLKTAGLATVGGATLAIAGCSANEASDAAAANDLPEITWDMATSWPRGLDTIFGGAEQFAATVSALSGGKFTINPREAGELVGGLEVLPSVQEGGVKAGHTASYYYIGKSPITAFGTTLPFGLTDRQQNAWLYEGGGLEILQAQYAEKFNMIQFPAGNTGAQMGGWYNKEINTPADLEGLKMRIPGLGGKALEKLGVLVQQLPGGEVFQALQTGAIDATDWVGPYDDKKLGFDEIASFYYYPGWWEAGPSLEVQFGLDEWNNLPEEYQAIIEAAAYVANATMMARYDVRNPVALEEIKAGGKVQILPFSDAVMEASKEAADQLMSEMIAQDQDFADIFANWDAFRKSSYAWLSTAELAMLQTSALQI